MGVALLDSSAIIGFLHADDALHPAADQAIRTLAREHVLAVSAVSCAEVLTGAKLGHHGEATCRRFLTEVATHHLPVDTPTAERAAELRARNRTLRMPDALILASADLGADVVVSGDERWADVPGLACEVELLRA